MCMVKYNYITDSIQGDETDGWLPWLPKLKLSTFEKIFNFYIKDSEDNGTINIVTPAPPMLTSHWFITILHR